MKSILLGQLRINLQHVVWYTPVGHPGDAHPAPSPALSVKTVDSPQAVSIQYRSYEARDADLARLDALLRDADAG